MTLARLPMSAAAATAAPALPDDERDEAGRLAALRGLQVLDSGPEPVFDAITDTAAKICGVPVALISLVDAQRLWFKSSRGLHGVDQAPRDTAFCGHAIRASTLMEVPDAALDPRFADNPMVVGDPGIRFYAGAPIVVADGSRVGTVCVMDREPRQLDDQQCAMLSSLATIVGAMLVQRRQLLEAAGKLASSEQSMRRLYEATPAILYSIGTDGRIVSVSDRWLALLDYERDEVLGRQSTDFLSPASKAHALEVVLPEFFRAGRCDNIEYQFVRRDGSAVDVLLSAVLERDPESGSANSVAVLEDVSATKRLAAELGRAHAHLDAVLDNMPALVGYWDRAQVTRFANRDFQAAVGLPTDRIVGRPLREIFTSVDAVGFEAMTPYIAAVLQGQRQEFECGLLTISGLRQLRVTLVPAQPVDGQVDGFYGTWFDITGMKTLELRQRDSEHRYRLLFDHLPSAYALHAVELDAGGRPVDYRFIAMNTAFCKMLGVDPARAIGARASEVFPQLATDPADWIARLGRVALTGETIHFEQLSSTGRWWDVVAYRPAPGQFAVIAQDISAHKQR